MAKPKPTSKQEVLRRLFLPLRNLLLVSLLLAGLIGSAIHSRRIQTASNQAAATTLADAETRAEASKRDREAYNGFRNEFLTLKKNGVIGPEQRMPWIDYYSALVESGNPQALKLTITPQRPFEQPPSQPLDNMQFFASRLSLDAKAYHEGDVLQMTDRLKQVAGAHLLQSCLLIRETSNKKDTNLDVHCEADIITLNAPAPIPVTGG